MVELTTLESECMHILVPRPLPNMKVPAASASEARTSMNLAPYPWALAGAQPFTAGDEPIACTTSQGAAAFGFKEPGIGSFPHEPTERA